MFLNLINYNLFIYKYTIKIDFFNYFNLFFTLFFLFHLFKFVYLYYYS